MSHVPLVPTHARLDASTIDIPIRDRHPLQVLEHHGYHLESVAGGRVHPSDCTFAAVLCVWRDVERWNPLWHCTLHSCLGLTLLCIPVTHPFLPLM